jgi:hypothetical protein
MMTFRGRLNVVGQILGDMIASRWSTSIDELAMVGDSTSEVARLKSVYLQSFDGLDEETTARLGKLRDEGLELVIEKRTWWRNLTRYMHELECILDQSMARFSSQKNIDIVMYYTARS